MSGGLNAVVDARPPPMRMKWKKARAVKTRRTVGRSVDVIHRKADSEGVEPMVPEEVVVVVTSNPGSTEDVVDPSMLLVYSKAACTIKNMTASKSAPMSQRWD